MLFKYFIDQSGDLPEVKELIRETIAAKNEGLCDDPLSIRFTNDPDYVNRPHEAKTEVAQYDSCKTDEDFQSILNNFYNNPKSSSKVLLLQLKVLEDARALNYITSNVEKVRKDSLDNSQPRYEEVQDKRVRLVYLFQRGRKDLKADVKEEDVPVSHFSPYTQEFDDGKLGEISNKTELFKTLINMEKLLDYVTSAFEFDIEGENPARTQHSLSKVLGELHKR